MRTPLFRIDSRGVIGMDFLSKSGASLCFRKRIRRDSQPVSLDADMIRLLLAIDERKSLYQIAAEVEMDAATFKTNLKQLARAGSHRDASSRPTAVDWTSTFLHDHADESGPDDRTDGGDRRRRQRWRRCSLDPAAHPGGPSRRAHQPPRA
ncbi:MAG: hypothetical protein MZV70_50860 [Desulfobacterales bacterium]|nr:hypothetical protein [Desulfobacterales bacterium]